MSPLGRHRLVVSVSILTVFVTAELGARLAARRLPPPPQWELPAVEVLRAQMRRVPDGGVAFVGASQAGTDFVPVEFLARSRVHRTAFNAWLVGAGMRTIARWTLEFVVPELDPSVVVVGVTSREMNDNLGEDVLHKYEKSRAVIASARDAPVLERVRLRAERWSALVRLRDRLRSPVGLARALRTGNTTRRTEDPGIGDLGVLADRVNQPFTAHPAHVERERRALARYRTGGVQEEALRALITGLHDRGIAVVVVNLPTYEPITVPMHPRGNSDLARYWSTLRSVASDTKAVLLDGRNAGAFGREDFADPEHLNGRGASRLTAWLATELDRRAKVLQPDLTGRPTAGRQP